MTTHLESVAALDLSLLNDWQRDFPVCPRPFDTIAEALQTSTTLVQQRYRLLQASGALSRIGGIFGVGAGGSAMLCALAVTPDRLQTVAQQVNAFDYVNHNYARDHHWNLWFVVTAPSVVERDACVAQIEAVTGLRALRLPMRRAFRIDLGFDLRTGHTQPVQTRRCESIAADDRPLAAAIEEGLPITEWPYAQWARQINWTEQSVLNKIHEWVEAGVLRRWGAIVRHHELGVAANAMTVFNVPDEQLTEHGQQLARQTGITLCYARHRDEGWPYNLYCMVHGRSPSETLFCIEQARQQTGLHRFDHAVLFSTERFKQTGGRYFRHATAPAQAEAA
ncbi:MAG TPA: Lrp/AsnC family transcriptional regulator [Aquabacterium sp.]|nr:Lrp/AsnC family transcriptional regulator [Aquabacterium sp.]